MKTLLTALALVSVVLIDGCKKDKFVERVGVCPLVISTNPANAATGVPLNQVITATFNEEMNPSTITQQSFTLYQGTTKIAGTLSYNKTNTTLSFVPASPLTVNTTYTGTVTTAVKDLMGNALQENYVWTFSTGLSVLPVVISTDPLNGDSNVVRNKVISATFNMPMDPLTINGSTFTLKQGLNTIAGTVSYSGVTAFFTPTANLLPGTVYTATITTGAKNTSGTAIASNYVWAFKTGTVVAPTVISTDPANGATGVLLNKIITATFSEPMDPLTITSTTFLVKQGLTPVAGTVTYSGSTATFTPSANLLPGVVYTCTITTGAKNIAGTALANDYVWSFTTIAPTAPTVISTDPANAAINVPLNKIITATFSEPMDALTLNTTTFIVKQGLNPVAGTVSYIGSTATFTPLVNLLPGTIYTATITTGAKNIAGTPLAADYVWSFTTLTPLAPTVISTDPANGATGVLVTKIITATFSTPMDPATINTTTFIVKEGLNPVAGVVSYIGSTATFTPSVNLLNNKVYTCTITTGAKNVAGTPLAADYIWSFTTAVLVPPTVISTDPANGATNVALNKIITATFSVPMDALTINTSTFTLKLAGVPVSGTVSYIGSTATFTPDVNLISGKTYTATITTGAKNVAGTPLTADYVWTFDTKAPLGPKGPDLKSVARFGIISGVGVSNNAGFSVINDMDVGISPGVRSSITGFPPAIVVNGAIYASDDLVPAGTAAMLIQAKQDLTDAYLFAEGATTPAPATVSGDQGGLTLAPGIYKSTSTLLIQNGDLTLDAQGDVNAVWIFQVAAGFTTVGGAGGNVILSGGAKASNVYWQVGSSAIIGDYTNFKGNVLALTSITMNSHATADGRMLARNGAVVLTHTNIINKP